MPCVVRWTGWRKRERGHERARGSRVGASPVLSGAAIALCLRSSNVSNNPGDASSPAHKEANFHPRHAVAQPVPSNATELLFLEHIMKKLKPRDGARCGMVMPEGTLFRGGAFATVKKDLLEQRGRTPCAPTDTHHVGAHGVRPTACAQRRAPNGVRPTACAQRRAPTIGARADGRNAGRHHPPPRIRTR